jgi:hypothetical protein
LVLASYFTAASEGNPQPPTSDGDPPNTLDAKEWAMLMAVALWVFVQVPVALLMGWDANRKGLNGLRWLLLGGFPVVGYGALVVFLWIRARHHPGYPEEDKDDRTRPRVAPKARERDGYRA